MSRQAVAARAFHPIVLSKLGLAVALSGGYYLVNGPYVSFDRNAYGIRALLPKFDRPAGING
jgi:hypothetical protein